ncbi:MAG: putative Fidgetin protein 1 [Streblomastix strix]|uniref:Putative Fidgetin protein 1 n=1 Tax=Streblomastix strix TaxID=222440 RepID=A0A5J4X092_9EUKA|nr:MAG: putative Fidgetin protein 1 [Streblomastix strix]
MYQFLSSNFLDSPESVQDESGNSFLSSVAATTLFNSVSLGLNGDNQDVDILQNMLFEHLGNFFEGSNSDFSNSDSEQDAKSLKAHIQREMDILDSVDEDSRNPSKITAHTPKKEFVYCPGTVAKNILKVPPTSQIASTTLTQLSEQAFEKLTISLLSSDHNITNIDIINSETKTDSKGTGIGYGNRGGYGRGIGRGNQFSTPIRVEQQQDPQYYGGNLQGGVRVSGLQRTQSGGNSGYSLQNRGQNNSNNKSNDLSSYSSEQLGGLDPNDERLKGLDPKLIETISHEIMDRSPSITWDDIAGLEFAKKKIMEEVIWPMLRPDIFTGLRQTARGVLLFGPPGTGKTMIGKAIASITNSTFFSISASSLMSKWVGEGEKLVKTLFAVAGCHQNPIIFIDEIDSLLTSRQEGDAEATRRVKTEFLVQLDGVGTAKFEKVLIIGATNRPQELDEAARRRMVTRLYIPLPDQEARKQLIKRLLLKNTHQLSDIDIDFVVSKSAGYSGSDIFALCANAARGPLREIASISLDISKVSVDSVRPINAMDFETAFREVRASVDQKDLEV